MKDEITKVAGWIKDQCTQAKKEKIVIGVSGGVDSAVSAAISVLAMGKENVIGVILPCTSSPESKEDALKVIKHLGISYWEQNLEKPYEAMVAGLLNGTNTTDKTVVGNIKSRLRMIALYAMANEQNALVCGTTNRTEALIGYYTKFGDGGVDIEPICQYYKGEVREMARILGIPEIVITKAPTADLGISSSDEEEISKIVGEPITYDQIDTILKSAIDGAEMAEGITNIQVAGIMKMFKNSEHKRNTPPDYEREYVNTETDSDN